MLGHGQEVIHFLNKTEYNHHVICVQETWYNGSRMINIPNYQCICRDRIGQSRGGCALYIHDSINYDDYICDEELELQSISILFGKQKMTLVNFYNPCKKLDENILDKIFSYAIQSEYIIIGDFNAHNTLWGSEKNDANGNIIVKALEKYNAVIMNDGSGTRVDTHSGKLSHLDLTIISPSLAGKGNWKVVELLGSDHYLIELIISLKTGVKTPQANKDEEERFFVKNIDWEKFRLKCENTFKDVVVVDDVQIFYDNFMKGILKVLKEISPPRKKDHKHDPIPWWTNECSFKNKRKK